MSCALYDPHAATLKKGDYIKKKKSMDLVKPVDHGFISMQSCLLLYLLPFIIFDHICRKTSLPSQ